MNLPTLTVPRVIDQVIVTHLADAASAVARGESIKGFDAGAPTCSQFGGLCAAGKGYYGKSGLELVNF